MTHLKPSWRIKRNETEAEKKAREEEALRESAERRAAEQRSRRSLLTYFQLWRVCRDKRCVRAHACRGDLNRCDRDRWRVYIPDEVRITLGKAHDLARDGMPWPDAVKEAYRDMAERAAYDKQVAARLAAAATAPAAPPQPDLMVQHAQPRPALPRIRSL